MRVLLVLALLLAPLASAQSSDNFELSLLSDGRFHYSHNFRNVGDDAATLRRGIDSGFGNDDNTVTSNERSAFVIAGKDSYPKVLSASGTTWSPTDRSGNHVEFTNNCLGSISAKEPACEFTFSHNYAAPSADSFTVTIPAQSNQKAYANFRGDFRAPSGGSSLDAWIVSNMQGFLSGSSSASIMTASFKNFDSASFTLVRNSDADTIGNPTDNCDFVANEDQANQDGDAFGDACDADRDGDGVPNDADKCPGGDDRIDSDADGTPNGCDPTPSYTSTSSAPPSSSSASSTAAQSSTTSSTSSSSVARDSQNGRTQGDSSSGIPGFGLVAGLLALAVAVAGRRR